MKHVCRCEICLEPVEQTQGKGRPRTMHPECAQLKRNLDWLRDTLVSTAPNLNTAAKNRIRSELFSIINHNFNGPRNA